MFIPGNRKEDVDVTEIKKIIRKRLLMREDVLFAYLFGSFVTGESFRDIDLAVFFAEETDLLQIGLLKTELEKHVQFQIDLVKLNGLAKKNPAFAFEVVTRGELLVNLDATLQEEYKRRSMLFYFDTAYLRKRVNKAFEKRLEMNQFGKRDYA